MSAAHKPQGYTAVAPYLIVNGASGTTWWIATRVG